ncbi:MAG: N-acetylneuraminate synthase family protein, partial [Candidatus Omnitrophota bacterium]
HITLSKTAFGTDHILSADPEELKKMVEYARRIEVILGKGEKVLTRTEQKHRDFLRKRFSRSKK